MNKKIVKLFGKEKIQDTIQYRTQSKVVTRTYDDSEFGASYNYEPIAPYHIDMIEAVLRDEPKDGFRVFINDAYFQDEVWDEDNTGLIEIGKEIDENTSLHILVQTNLDYNFLGGVTNTNINNPLAAGDEVCLEDVYYKVLDVVKSEMIIKGVQYYEIELHPLFIKTLKEKNILLQLGLDAISRVVLPGETYKHFKENFYEIIAIAEHKETSEKMVVYKALYGENKIYARPYNMFLSLVDFEKYPNVKQLYRMEKID